MFHFYCVCVKTANCITAEDTNEGVCTIATEVQECVLRAGEVLWEWLWPNKVSEAGWLIIREKKVEQVNEINDDEY